MPEHLDPISGQRVHVLDEAFQQGLDGSALGRVALGWNNSKEPTCSERVPYAIAARDL